MTIASALKKSSLVALAALSAACSNTYTPHGITVDNFCVEKFGEFSIFVDTQGPKENTKRGKDSERHNRC